MRYLTPGRFRNMGMGVDLSGVSDLELASILSRAADMADAYCAVPTLPQRYDFRGGTITDETHAFMPGQIRVFPRHRPVRDISSFQVFATNNVYLSISPNDIFVEPRGGWIEIVALSMSPVGFWAASGLISITNPVLKLDYTYGYTFTVTDEYLTTGDQFVYHAQNQYWDPSPEVKVNGTIVTTGFETNLIEGTITFDSAQDSSDIVTVSYVHSIPSAVSQAVGHIATSLLGESSLISKGLGNLAEIQVEEVRLRRDSRRTGTMVVADALPNVAMALLAPYRFISIR